MANPNHLALLEQGIVTWNRWRLVNPSIMPELCGADLRGADLRGANLIQTDLRRADLRGANLVGADLRRADLRGANLVWADLEGANFEEADLEGANLEGANLEGADLDSRVLYLRDFFDPIFLDEIPLESSVLVGVSAPANVRPGEEFTVRFVAYIQDFESHLDKILKGLSPRSKSYLEMGWCRWQEGVQVTVILSCQYLDIAEPQQKIEWHKPYQIIPFDIVVQKTAPETTVVLKLDVYILDIRVAALRLDLNICKVHRVRIKTFSSQRKYKRAKPATSQRKYKKAKPATTAFASYASQDRLRVLDRVDALQRSVGMDVFQDCLSLHPGEPWKEKLLQEILGRNLFLLFWSKFAKDSQWVKWEWTTALEKRGEEVIQLHPLDTIEEAPPPPELAHLHFESPLIVIRKYYQSNTVKTNP